MGFLSITQAADDKDLSSGDSGDDSSDSQNSPEEFSGSEDGEEEATLVSLINSLSEEEL